MRRNTDRSLPINDENQHLAKRLTTRQLFSPLIPFRQSITGMNRGGYKLRTKRSIHHSAPSSNTNTHSTGMGKLLTTQAATDCFENMLPLHCTPKAGNFLRVSITLQDHSIYPISQPKRSKSPPRVSDTALLQRIDGLSGV